MLPPPPPPHRALLSAFLGVPILAGAPPVGKPFTRHTLVRALQAALGRVNEA